MRRHVESHGEKIRASAMLRTLDLFTGIGGITHALRGLATPIGYCEINSGDQAILRNLMARKALPTAPIHPDVRKLDPRAFRGKVDMIVAGWPCVGFSSSGLREGFANEQSGLFKHMMAVIAGVRPPFVFMENVAPITQVTAARRDNIRSVAKAFGKLDYDLWWIVLPAHAVGAPQIRLRWFCLCVRRDVRSRRLVTAQPYSRFVWSKKTEPAERMVPPSRTGRLQIQMMGNSVVPDCARAAFCLLWTGLRKPLPEVYGNGTRMLDLARPVPGKVLDDAESPFSYACALADGVVRAIPAPRGVDPVKDWGIVLDPKLFKPPRDAPPGPERTSGDVTKSLRRRVWATPRVSSSSCNSSRFLTRRCKNDLPTQLRFDRATPDAQRPGVASPKFAMWLMGYPRGWLDFGKHRVSLHDRLRAT